MPKTNLCDLKVISVLMIMISTTNTLSAPLQQEVDERLTIDWSRLELQFYGDSRSLDDDKNQSYELMENSAWTDGLVRIRQKTRALFRQHYENGGVPKEVLQSESVQAGLKVETTTYSVNTKYFPDGHVRVYMRNSLVRALARKNVDFKVEELPPFASKYTGVAFLGLDKDLEPFPEYTVVNEAGEVLFTVEDMDPKAYHKHLMGHWFNGNNTQLATAYVGNDPIKVKVAASKDNTLVIKDSDWRAHAASLKNLMASGKVSLFRAM